MTFETVIHGGTIVTAEGQFQGDIGIADGRIVAVSERLDGGDTRIDAGGPFVAALVEGVGVDGETLP